MRLSRSVETSPSPAKPAPPTSRLSQALLVSKPVPDGRRMAMGKTNVMVEDLLPDHSSND